MTTTQHAPIESAPAPVDPRSTSHANGAAAPAHSVPVAAAGGMTINADTGEIILDHLVPQGLAVELGPEMDGVVFPVEALSLDKLNADFNPWKEEPKAPSGKPAIGAFTGASSIYDGKTFIPIKDIVAGAIKAMNEQALAAMKPFVDLLSPYGILDMPVHQFPIPGTQGNRVVFYGDPETSTRIHKDIDALVHHLGKRHLRVLKLMCHFNLPAASGEGSQGGALSDVVKEGVGGATHLGGFSSGFEGGKPATAKSDWPSSYGSLQQALYNAHLLVVDYAQGTHDPIPARELAAYKHNADMWDCCAGMLVPFAGGVANDPFRHYKYNPLEIHSQATALSVAKAMAALDQASFLKQCGSFYCAEGQYSIANLGPQDATLLKKSTWGGTAFGKIIEYFATAPGYAGMTAEQRRQRPEIGWKHLLDNRVITADHHGHLTNTHRTAIALEFLPEDVKGWQAYRPKNADGLIARPMTVATLAWGHLGRYMPREAMAKLLVLDINRAWQAGGAPVKAMVSQLLRGADPATPAGQTALAGLAGAIATGVLVSVLKSTETRGKLLEQAGYAEIVTAEDKKKVDEAYDTFVQLLDKAAALGTKDALNAAFVEADRKLSKLEVTRKVKNFAGEDVQNRSLMLYAAPHCFGIWAQSPLLAETGCIRYVATAMHESQMAPGAGASRPAASV